MVQPYAASKGCLPLAALGLQMLSVLSTERLHTSPHTGRWLHLLH